MPYAAKTLKRKCLSCASIEADAVRREGTSQGETFATLHSSAQVKVSKEEAERIDRESTDRLLKLRKLALIVDLDQTLIHVTVDPTVADWARDVHNPNWPALRDIAAFQLGADGSSVTHEPEVLHSYDASSFATGGEENGCWYYVKLRPGVKEFLAFLAERFELHVYTMGTRSYAECICSILDPSGHLFGSRILSRDENENMVQKSLSRLFPTNTSMAVIIDDRADVWNWSPNLIKVQPYEFFIGIGDINAAFLPTGNEAFTLPNKAAPEPDEKEAPSPEAQSKANHAHQTHRQVISEQKDSRPLKRRQEELKGRQGTGHKGHDKPKPPKHGGDAKENEDPGAPASAEHDDSAEEKADAKHDTEAAASGATERAAHENTAEPASEAVLHDEDQELPLISTVLDKVHSQWYAAWEEQCKKGADAPLPEAKVRSTRSQLHSHAGYCELAQEPRPGRVPPGIFRAHPAGRAARILGHLADGHRVRCHMPRAGEPNADAPGDGKRGHHQGRGGVPARQHRGGARLVAARLYLPVAQAACRGASGAAERAPGRRSARGGASIHGAGLSAA